MKKRKYLITIMIIVICMIVWIAWGNTALQLRKITIVSEKIPAAFSGYKIVQVSDLHNANFGNNNKKLIEIVKQAKPDIIVVTGDLVDSSRTDIEVALNFIEQALNIAPIYYITGNHEAMLSKNEYSRLENGLSELGVIVLHNEVDVLEQNGEKISIAGLDDPSYADKYGSDKGGITPEGIQDLFDTEDYKILLSHRPECFNQYIQAEVDLVFSGHAHGGQFRLPFIGGIVAPGQGLFPKYDSGLYSENGTNMVVSRGIGNSIIPIRFNNRPEVILTVLRGE